MTLRSSQNDFTNLFISGAKTSWRKIKHAVTVKRSEGEDTDSVQMNRYISAVGDLRA